MDYDLRTKVCMCIRSPPISTFISLFCIHTVYPYVFLFCIILTLQYIICKSSFATNLVGIFYFKYHGKQHHFLINILSHSRFDWKFSLKCNEQKCLFMHGVHCNGQTCFNVYSQIH